MALFAEFEKKLGTFVLKVKLDLKDETIALLGASGSGKSLTLQCIAGIHKPDRGKIVLDGVTLFDSEKGIDLPPQKRQVGLLFQNYALFPHMTVLQNIAAGARRNGSMEAVQEIMERFELTKLADRYPRQLSGGEQQRTALARILVSAPRILLLDEPFSALDSHLRFRLQQDLLLMTKEFGKTVILVSHDRDEAFRLANAIAVIDHGEIKTAGEKHRVFADPKTKAAALLTGCKNISCAEQIDEETVFAADWGVSLKISGCHAAYVGVRMHHIQYGPGENAVRCCVVEEMENPFSVTVLLAPVSGKGTVPLAWELDKDQWQKIRAEEVEIHLPADAILLLGE